MTIPNVTITWCQRRAQCDWCPGYIEAGEPLVTAFFWNRGTPDHKGFNVKKYWHVKCWIEQGLDYLEMNPYVPYLRKPKLDLSPEQSKQRYSLLKRKAAIDQRIRKLDKNFPDNLLDEVRLQGMITELMLEIAPLGGIPAKWLNQNSLR